MSNEINIEEKTIWEGKPSQWLNFKTYVYCIMMMSVVFIAIFGIMRSMWLALFLLYPAVRALFAWYEVHSINYKLTNLRLLHREGVFNRITTETKLSEIKEVLLIEPWYKRIVGLGDIQLNIYGFSESHILVTGVCNAEETKELFNNAVKQNHNEN
jgi:uncharacterized membrane protein YdbT with pleckstrin-like domain